MFTNNTQNGNAKKGLKTLALIYLVLDLIWATAFATLNATVLHVIGGAAHAGEGATTLATVLTWCITFAVAFFQGAVFLVVISIFGFVLYAIFSGSLPKGGGTK